MHHSVMVKEVVAWLRPVAGGIYIDATVGEGGHAAAILGSSEPSGRIIGLDHDAAAVAAASDNLRRFSNRVTLIHANFREAFSVLQDIGVSQIDGALLDLGVSSRQLDTPARGFSFQHEGPLDMRMDPREAETAADLVNRRPEAELARIIYEYGEERYSRRIARAIIRSRQRGAILTTQALVAVIRGSVPPPYLHGRLHFATRTFQALRIAVNHELEHLRASLETLAGLLKSGGRLVVLSFHSLEDRVVKQTFRELTRGQASEFLVLTKRPMTPSPAECRENPRARSAKLRALARKEAAA
jgi:16S rRNA (cytosine1402-N4)-methyltransferase